MPSDYPAVSATHDPLFDMDVDIDDDASGGNPFPGSDKSEWTSRFADVLAAETGLPREICDGIAPYVVRPKRYILIGRRGAPDTLRPGTVSVVAGQKILTVEMHGFAGNAGEYNERIRRSFDSPVKPGADPERVLPVLVTGQTAGGNLAPYITTEQPVPHDRVNRLLGIMSQALDAADGTRGYRLDEDIEIYGQQEPTLHVPLLRRISEPDEDGGLRVRQVVDLTAIKGANRSRARLKLFNLTPEHIVYGVDPYELMGLPKRKRSAEPRVWVPAFADLLQQAWQDPDNPGHQVATKAQKIAVITVNIIVGSRNLAEFHNSTFDPNRVDHRRPPLDYSMAEKASSDMRALLRDRKRRGLESEARRAWLAGEGPDPAPVAGETPVDARDRRDLALLDIVFPAAATDPDAALEAREIRNVLGEPSRSQTTARQVEHRTRMYSSTASDGYHDRWNPRVLDGLYGSRAIKDGESFAGYGTWSQLLAAAEAGDVKALEVFIKTRGMHWLAEHRIVEADRGSVGAQTDATIDADDPEELQRAKRVRRTMSNVSAALQADPHRAVAVFRELAHATNTGAAPRMVDIVYAESDADSTPIYKPVEDTVMSREWFTVTFPKTNGVRPRPKPEDDLPPQPEPAMPAPSPQQVLVSARGAFVASITDDLMETLAEAMRLGGVLVEAGHAAGQVPLPDTLTDVVELVEKALNTAKNDVRMMTANVSALKLGDATKEDFISQAATFLDEVSE